MNVVFNNAELYIVDYPAIDAIEIIDKRVGRGGMMRAETAHRFRAELEVWAESGEEADVDAIIGAYGALMTQQAIYH